MKTKKTEVLILRIEPQLKQALESFAAQTGSNQSEVVRVALLKQLEPKQSTSAPTGA